MQPVSALTTGDVSVLRPAPSEEGLAPRSSAVEYKPEPWGRRDVVQFVVLSVVALVLLAAGWLGAGGEALLEDQMPFINLAITGLLVGAAAGALWVIAGWRSVRLRKATVKAMVAARAAAPTARVVSLGSEVFVAGAAMTRFHRPGCSLVAGKEVDAVSRADHEGAGRRACGLCDPTGERAG